MDTGYLRKEQSSGDLPTRDFFGETVKRSVQIPLAEKPAFNDGPKSLRRTTTFRSLVAVGCLSLFFSCMLPKTPAQDGIFATPTNNKQSSNDPYPTAAAFLAATRSGEIPELLRDKSKVAWVKLGRSVYVILMKEYGLNREHLYGGVPQDNFGLLMQSLTDYEIDNHDQDIANGFRTAQKQLFGSDEDKSNRAYNDSRAAFNKFAVEYSNALKEYLAPKRRAEEERQVKLANGQRLKELAEKEAVEARRKNQELADAAAKKAAVEDKQKQKVADARAASLKAQEDIKTTALNAAMEKQKRIRAQKLKECLESPAYTLWEVALQVEQGEELRSSGQSVLDHDDAVRRASGVTDLAARRTAGEQIVAGKSMADSAFAEYKKLGGKAAKPSEVVPGPDPAADYR